MLEWGRRRGGQRIYLHVFVAPLLPPNLCLCLWKTFCSGLVLEKEWRRYFAVPVSTCYCLLFSPAFTYSPFFPTCLFYAFCLLLFIATPFSFSGITTVMPTQALLFIPSTNLLLYTTLLNPGREGSDDGIVGRNSLYLLLPYSPSVALSRERTRGRLFLPIFHSVSVLPLLQWFYLMPYTPPFPCYYTLLMVVGVLWKISTSLACNSTCPLRCLWLCC